MVIFSLNICKLQVTMPRLSENERNRAVGLLHAGISIRAVARQFNCHHSTITRLNARFRQTGSTPDRQRPGQPQHKMGEREREKCFI